MTPRTRGALLAAAVALTSTTAAWAAPHGRDDATVPDATELAHRLERTQHLDASDAAQLASTVVHDKARVAELTQRIADAEVALAHLRDTEAVASEAQAGLVRELATLRADRELARRHAHDVVVGASSPDHQAWIAAHHRARLGHGAAHHG